MIKVIHIFGASGSGTSTLGRALQAELGYQHLDVDDYFWFRTDPPYTHKRPAPERAALLAAAIDAAEKSAVTGSLCGWGDPLISLLDLAIRIELPAALRLARLKNRESERYGARILPGGDLHQVHLDFIAWTTRYDTADASVRSKALHDDWFEKLNCAKLRIDGANPVEENLRMITMFIGNHA